MKIVKNVAIVVFTTTFMFAGIGFHMATNYSTLQEDDITVATSYGISYALNGTTSVGFDSALGMLMTFGVGNATLRMGWTAADTSVGLGFTWWNGGDGLNTSISTNYDLVGTGDDSDGNLSMVVGFGF